MTENLFTEKRLYPRFEISLPAGYLDPSLNQIIDAKTFDISSNGISLLTNRFFEPGTTLNVFLQMLDDGKKIFRKGTVIWWNLLENGKFRLGVKVEEEKIEAIPIVLRTIMAKRLKA